MSRSLIAYGAIRFTIGILAAAPLIALILHNPTIAPAWAALPSAAAIAWAVIAVSRRRAADERRESAELPPGVQEAIEELVVFYGRLNPEEKERFLQRVAIFLAEHKVTGVGVELDDRLRACVAASAVIVTFGLEPPLWDARREILLYADRFEYDYSTDEDAGLLGMVHEQGPVIFAAGELLGAYEVGEDGFNVGLHEFAHLLDYADGGIDGLPSHLHPQTAKRFGQKVQEVLAEALQITPLGELLDDYAYTDEAEFFACITEVFFELPDLLHDADPEMYSLLSSVYYQDPLSRITDEDRAAVIHPDPDDFEEGPELTWAD